MPDRTKRQSATTFIGRQHELSAIVKLLTDPACRLLNLSGVGGIGKTQLALRVLDQLQDDYVDGAAWVDLQPLLSGDYLIPAIADAVGAILSGQAQLQQQLCRYLETKHQLLVLDNFEHLLEHVDVLTEILDNAPHIKLLVTSRETLNLQEEWLYTLSGLSLPSSHEMDGLEMFDAIRLFLERAMRVRSDFSLADEQAGVVRICQLVEGMPLAIEMAAAWTKSLRCSAIAAEIQQNVKFLTSRLHNVPERHRSMEAVFAQTWDRLTDEERVLFARLSVFRGGFQPEAAQVIADASFNLLATLLDKSLLHRDAAGRYHLHELLRQYAESQLSPEAAEQVAIAHCHYYADYLDGWLVELNERDQAKAAAAIEAELENCRAAWQTALHQVLIPYIQILARILFHYGQMQGRYLELVGVLEPVFPILEAQNEQHALAHSLVYLGWIMIRLGRLERAAQLLEQSWRLFEQLDITPNYGMGAHPLAPFIILEVVRGNYAEALHKGETLIHESQRFANQDSLSFAYYGLTSAHYNLGDYDMAYQCARQAVTLAGDNGNRWFMAYCLNEWGRVAGAMGDYSEAEAHYRLSYQIRQAYRDSEGIAVVLQHLGELAMLRHDYAPARDLYDESLSIYQNLNDQGGLATAHHSLGQVALQTGHIDQAIQHLSQALTIATRIQFIPRILSILIDIGGLFLKSDHQPERGVELLRVVLQHPSSNQQQRTVAESILTESQLTDNAASPDLNNILIDTQIALKGLTSAVEDSANRALIEPLTERELEILQLLSNGLSNAEIGQQLFVAIGTVKAHTSHIYGKLGVRNRVEAIAKGRELSLLNLP
jgi:predicted ATPase/DNA-binding NarL/FixJ family response regulator